MNRRIVIFVALLLTLLIVPIIASGATKPQKVIVATDTGVLNLVNVNVGTAVRLTASVLPTAATTNGFVWKSDKTGVAKVSGAGIVSTLRAGKATITATSRYGNKSGKIVIQVIDPKIPTSITLNYTGSVKLGRGSMLTLGYSLAPNTSSSVVKWKSSNKSIATVSGNGVVTAKKKGKARITATTSTGKRTTKVDVVVPSFDILITKTSGNYVGEQIAWNVDAVNNVGEIEYDYSIYKDDIIYYRTTTSEKGCYIPLSEIGKYYLEVIATDEAGTSVVKRSGITDVVYINPIISICNTSVSYKSDYTCINVQVAVSSGKRPYKIFVSLYDGETRLSTKMLEHSTKTTFNINPSIHGTFMIRAEIKDASGNKSFDECNVTI